MIGSDPEKTTSNMVNIEISEMVSGHLQKMGVESLFRVVENSVPVF